MEVHSGNGNDDDFCPAWLKLQSSTRISNDAYTKAVVEYIEFEQKYCFNLGRAVEKVQSLGLVKVEGLIHQQAQILLASNRHLAALINAIKMYSVDKTRHHPSKRFDLLHSVSSCDLTKLHITKIFDECFDCPRKFSTKSRILSLCLKQIFFDTKWKQEDESHTESNNGHDGMYMLVRSITGYIIEHINAYPAMFKRLSSQADKYSLGMPDSIKYDLNIALIRINRYLVNINDQQLLVKLVPHNSTESHGFDDIASEALAQTPLLISGLLDSANDYKALGLRAVDTERGIKRARIRLTTKAQRAVPDKSMIKVINNYGTQLRQKCTALEAFRVSMQNHQASITKFYQQQIDFCAKWELHMDMPAGRVKAAKTKAEAGEAKEEQEQEEDRNLSSAHKKRKPSDSSPYIKSAWWSFHQKMRDHDRDVNRVIAELERRVLQPLHQLIKQCDAAAKRVWSYHRLLEGAETELINNELKVAAAEWSKEVPELIEYAGIALDLLVQATNEVTLEWTERMVGQERRRQYVDLAAEALHHPLNGCKHADIVQYYQTQFDMSMQ